MVRRLVIGTLLSILVFFAVSFLSILGQIAGPLNGHTPRVRLEVGWPFTFYQEFWVNGSESMNCGWHMRNLLFGCVLTWAVVTGTYLVLTRMARNQ
ncbi:MAG: hypothetical protein JNJ91_07035 [Flavobacteriales bacterium]|nr:hypothetical protein [Flavobacteriales bacterium]